MSAPNACARRGSSTSRSRSRIPDTTNAERIAGIRRSTRSARRPPSSESLGFAFTVNVVLHRGNLDHIWPIIEMAAELGADRIELANTQYYGWAYANRDALMPTRAQLAAAEPIVEAAVARYKGHMQILYVLPDYYQTYPKPCMGGWGNVYMVAAPDGRILPCQAAWQIESMSFDSVRDHSLEWIWQQSPAFEAFRGDAWMREPAGAASGKRSTHGGCRCQAFQLTGDARNADPVCVKSPSHGLIEASIVEVEWCRPTGIGPRASGDGRRRKRASLGD